ncbi:PucC family protein [Parasynechococcus sp.]|uniref:PucC family protein n=1 Tax=Parasynechococcus sp. TaxID=3101203 RepID=UPI003704BEF4
MNQVFGSACGSDASQTSVLAGLERLSVVTPLLLLGLGVVSVFGVERRITGLKTPVKSEAPDVPQRLALPQLLLQLRFIPQSGRFLGVLCLFTFSMSLNDAVLKPYGAAVFGMSVCPTTSLNVLIPLGFSAGPGGCGAGCVGVAVDA